MLKVREGVRDTKSGRPSVRFRKSSNTNECFAGSKSSSTNTLADCAVPRRGLLAVGNSKRRRCVSHCTQLLSRELSWTQDADLGPDCEGVSHELESCRLVCHSPWLGPLSPMPQRSPRSAHSTKPYLYLRIHMTMVSVSSVLDTRSVNTRAYELAPVLPDPGLRHRIHDHSWTH